jgi:hypothetical protein
VRRKFYNFATRPRSRPSTRSWKKLIEVKTDT